MSPKTYLARLTIAIAASGAGATVFVDADISLGGRSRVTMKARSFWEQELDGLVAALGGQVAEGGTAVPPQEFASALQTARIGFALRFGADWFFSVAGLSLANSVIHLANGKISLLIGMGIMQLVDALFLLIARAQPPSALAARATALGLDASVAVVFALFGVVARQGRTWAFIVGMVAYALGGLLLVWARDPKSLGFHLLVLILLYGGLAASRKLERAKVAGAA